MYDLLITNGLIIDGTGSAPYRADVVATFEAPHSYPTGVAHVAVNSVLAVEHGALTGRTPGKVMRSFAD